MEKMAKEIELKIMDVDKGEVLKRLKSLGARHIGTYDFRRIIFVLDKSKSKWLRVRTDGKKHTLTMKVRTGGARLTGTEEYEVEVSDFVETARMLCKIYKDPLYEENKRIEYSLKGAQVTIDKWPEIPWFVEIEAKRADEVRKVQKLLHIKGRPVGNISAADGYRMYGLNLFKIAGRNRAKLDRLINGN